MNNIYIYQIYNVGKTTIKHHLGMVDLGMVDSNHCYNHQPEDTLELCRRWRSSGAL